MKKDKRKARPVFSRVGRVIPLVISVLLFCSHFAFSQQTGTITVTGTVTDETGTPMIGANILEKGTSNGTITNLDGFYSLNVPSTSTLVFSYIGYTDQEQAVKGQRTVNVQMSENARALDEVVVTALGIKKQAKALGYAVAEVKGDDITKGRSQNAITALSGKMAGVDVSTGSGGPSGSTRVVIRGSSQLSGSNMPLYVVDGVPMDNTQLGSAGSGGGYDMGDGLASINPDDIESISVLKGASASALYGSRASNGVVLITTKSGKGQKGIGVDFTSNVNAVVIAKGFDDYQRVYGQGTGGQPPVLESSARTSSQSAWGAKLDPNTEHYIFNGQRKPYGNVNDNIMSFFRTGVTYTNTLSVSSSTEKNDFRVSISDMRNKDIVPSSDMYRTTIMMKGNARLGSKLTVDARANYSREGVNNRPALSDSPNNIGNSLIGIAPNFDQKWLADGYKDADGRYNDWNGNEYRLNPYWSINEMNNKSNKDRLMGHVQFNYDILPYLSAQVRAGMDYSKFHFTDFVGMYTVKREAGEMSETLTEIHEMNYEGMLRFNKRFYDILDVSAFIGGNIMKYEYESYYMFGSGQIMPDVRDIMNYQNISSPQHTLIRKQVNSAFGAVNLGYKDMLYLDFTLRNDWSSTLFKDNRSYMYPSVSGSVLLSEIFDLKPAGISFAKVRASWAEVGGDTDPYKLFLVYNLLPYTIGGKAAGQIANNDIMPLRDLKPTSTQSYEFGIDLRFLNDRIHLDLGYYHQVTKDQIMNLPVTSSSGYKSVMINAGEIVNKGIEASLNVIPVRTRDFEWSSNLNFAKNTNEVTKLHPELKTYELASATWAGASVVAMEGQPFGAIMGKKFLRNDENQVIFDNEGLPMFEEHVSVLGNGNYDFTLGWGNTFNYKGFSLSVLFDMKFGADLYSMSARTAAYNGTAKKTLEGREAWYQSEEQRRAENKTDKEWEAKGGFVGEGVLADGSKNTIFVDPQQYWRRVADNTPEPFIYDASYIKLREMTLSYNIPSKVLKKTPFEGISFTAYGRNLFILHTKLDNVDPESNYNNGNGQGLEYGSLPSRRTFGLSVNLKF